LLLKRGKLREKCHCLTIVIPGVAKTGRKILDNAARRQDSSLWQQGGVRVMAKTSRVNVKGWNRLIRVGAYYSRSNAPFFLEAKAEAVGLHFTSIHP
jgi:hypothetical protein